MFNYQSKFRLFLVCNIFVFIVLSCSLSFATANDLEVSISADSEAGASGTIVFTLKNHSTSAVEVLIWNTPFETRFNSRYFSVLRNGKKVNYTGRMVKRGKPKESDYITIEPGSSKSAAISLPEGYAMDSLGLYEVAFTGMLQYRSLGKQRADRALSKVKVRKRKSSNKLLLEVTSLPKPQAAYKQAATYTSCTSSQITVLDSVLTEAERIAIEARDILDSTPVSERDEAGRYISWFGSYTSARYSTTSTNITKISSALSDETIEFLCDCTEDYYAWVYPSEPYKIHICSAFWDAPLTGADSQSGTVVHEMSHFNVIAGTDDHVYGQDGAFTTAQSDPVTAIDNADNYEYFAENAPYLPMEKLFELQDNFSSSIQIRDYIAYSMVGNSNAGVETGEPSHAGQTGGKSLWFSWQAPATGNVEVTTIGSAIDTLLAVYTGTTLSGLSEIASNDDVDGTTQSRVSFTTQAGLSYKIAVDGYNGSAGMIYISISSHRPADLNGDNQVDLTDVITALQVVAGHATTVTTAGNIDQDNRIGLSEAIYALQVLSGAI